MDNYTELITKAWNEFVKYGIDNKKVKKDIRDSWIRCKEYNVDYMDGRGVEKYKAPVGIKVKENIDLVSVAHSIMENLYNTISGFRLCFIPCR